MVISKIWKRIQGWNEKFLSWAGKEILIKAVAQAIPTFAMGCFDLSKTLCDQIGAMICRYWWNNQEGKHKIHWLSREQMLKPKEEGGLGFRDIHHFNLAMLAKQGWRLLRDPDSLCARVLKAKYFPDTSVLEARQRSGMSYAWRSILRGIDIVKKGMIWRVGDGVGLSIWNDPWLPRDSVRKPITPRGATLLTEVSELMDPATGSWDTAFVRNIFWEEDASLILALPVHGDCDKLLAWHFDKHGRFSVKSAYKVSRDDPIQKHRTGGQGSSVTGGSKVWKDLWKLKCPSKIKHFLWRLSHNSHPLRGNLIRRGIHIDSNCVACGRVIEDGAHLFFKCKLARQIWRLMNLEEERVWLAEIPNAYGAVEYVLK